MKSEDLHILRDTRDIQHPRYAGNRLRRVSKASNVKVNCWASSSPALGPNRVCRTFRFVPAGLAWTFILFLFLSAGAKRTNAQCQGSLTALDDAARCTAVSSVPTSQTEIDPTKPYRLDELIDIAESNNPRTRIAWEAAKQAANRLGIARSDYYPHLAALVLSGDQRVIEPWAKPLGAPNGYFLIELPAVEAGVALQYNVYDFGRRGGRVEASKALRLATAALFQRTNQDVAFRVVTSYFNLITAQERLAASRQIVKTADHTGSR